ncbi:MAG: DNA starvation/stationary phase protection protein [bacterium]|nr:DNA starvation/stationary phase protection protein [bacterium]
MKIIDIGIEEKKRKEMAGRLNVLLANEYMLYTKTLKYHWNVKGKHFGPLHTLFRDQYEKLFTFVDTIAERVISLGFEVIGTLNEFSKHTTLTEQAKNPDELGMIKNLLADHQTIIKELREDIDASIKLNDAGTNNLLADVIEKQEKIAWMLRAHLG